MGDISKIVNYFGIESYDNYLSSNEAYNKCFSILYNSPVEALMDSKETCSPSIVELKENVYHKSALFLDNVDLSVDYMSYDNFVKYQHSIKSLEKKKQSVNIFELPVIYSEFNRTAFLSGFQENEKDMPIIVEYISLNKSESRNNLITECSYVHEMGHILSQRKKKSIKNFMHLEFIPIVLELLYAYTSGCDEALSANIIKRIAEFKKFYTSKFDIIDNLYNISQLLAFQTIEKYIDFDNYQKSEMISRLKDCLNCDIQAEEFMKDYDIGFNDTERSVKSFRKTLSRVLIK